MLSDLLTGLHLYIGLRSPAAAAGVRAFVLEAGLSLAATADEADILVLDDHSLVELDLLSRFSGGVVALGSPMWGRRSRSWGCRAGPPCRSTRARWRWWRAYWRRRQDWRRWVQGRSRTWPWKRRTTCPARNCPALSCPATFISPRVSARCWNCWWRAEQQAGRQAARRQRTHRQVSRAGDLFQTGRREPRRRRDAGRAIGPAERLGPNLTGNSTALGLHFSFIHFALHQFRQWRG